MIVAIATIEREAREAARAGKTPDEACRFPFTTPAGQRWKRFFNAERTRLQLAEANRLYAEAISESSCIN